MFKNWKSLVGSCNYIARKKSCFIVSFTEPTVAAMCGLRQLVTRIRKTQWSNHPYSWLNSHKLLRHLLPTTPPPLTRLCSSIYSHSFFVRGNKKHFATNCFYDHHWQPAIAATAAHYSSCLNAMGYLLPFTKWQSTLSDFGKVSQHLFSLKLCDFLVPLDAVSMGSNLGAPEWCWQHFIGPS